MKLEQYLRIIKNIIPAITEEQISELTRILEKNKLVNSNGQEVYIRDWEAPFNYIHLEEDELVQEQNEDEENEH